MEQQRANQTENSASFRLHRLFHTVGDRRPFATTQRPPSTILPPSSTPIYSGLYARTYSSLRRRNAMLLRLHWPLRPPSGEGAASAAPSSVWALLRLGCLKPHSLEVSSGSIGSGEPVHSCRSNARSSEQHRRQHDWHFLLSAPDAVLAAQIRRMCRILQSARQQIRQVAPGCHSRLTPSQA